MRWWWGGGVLKQLLLLAAAAAACSATDLQLEFLLPILVHPAHPPNVYRSYEPCRCALERAESRS